MQEEHWKRSATKFPVNVYAKRDIVGTDVTTAPPGFGATLLSKAADATRLAQALVSATLLDNATA